MVWWQFWFSVVLHSTLAAVVVLAVLLISLAALDLWIPALLVLLVAGVVALSVAAVRTDRDDRYFS